MRIDQLERECRAYSRYLAGHAPGEYLISKYREFHERAAAAAGLESDPFDRYLVEFSARGPFRARLADAYASRFRAQSALRKKLVLMLALLECSRDSFAALDRPDPGGTAAAFLRLAWYAAGYVGSLALGGSIGLIAVAIKQEILLFSVGGVFVLEALSVILQVASFRLTGKRIFRMAPLHHHFELGGWSESKIIVRFWIVALVLALFSLTTLKLR